MDKHHRNIGAVKLIRIVVPANPPQSPGLAEVQLPSGELRTVDLSWLTDPPPAEQTAPKDAPVPTPDAKPK